MSLNIKNAGTCQLVRELAELTGETQTMAAPRLREPFRTADHGDLLYDERGLPG